VTLSHQRWLLAGVLLGVMQTAKLSPGPLVALPVLWLWGKPGFLHVGLRRH